jgi:hypothetical protein
LVVKIIITHFEGTPEEYAQAKPMLSQSVASPDASERAHAAPRPSVAVNLELSVSVIEKALTRISLSKNQRTVLAIAAKAGEAGIYTNDLANKAGITRNQLTGVLGSLGRRIANTPGWPEDLSLGDSKWDNDKKQRRYWLHPLIREVMLSGRVKL